MWWSNPVHSAMWCHLPLQTIVIGTEGEHPLASCLLSSSVSGLTRLLILPSYCVTMKAFHRHPYSSRVDPKSHAKAEDIECLQSEIRHCSLAVELNERLESPF